MSTSVLTALGRRLKSLLRTYQNFVDSVPLPATRLPQGWVGTGLLLGQGLSRPANLIGLIALLVLLVLALYPFGLLVRQSFGEPATLAYWRSLLMGQATPVVPFWSPQHTWAFLWRPFQHSLVIAGLTTLLATGWGTGLAWLSAMTDLRYKRILHGIAIFHLILPPFALAIAWLSLAKSLRLPEGWTYGPMPMLLVLTIHFYAFAFLLIGAAIRNLDASLIEAAQIHGARNWPLLRRIIWPLLYPVVLASAGLIAFSTLAAFAPMQILGGGRQPYYVLATQIYSLYKNSLGDPRVEIFAVALAIILTTVSLLPFMLFLRLLRYNPRDWSVVSGRGHRPWTMKLGAWREWLSGLCLMISLLTVGAPLAILLLQSLSVDSGPHLTLTELTLAHYRALWATSHYLLSLGNSFLLAALTATAGVLIGLPIAYSLHRSRWWGLRSSLYLLTCLPSLLPGVALGLTYFTFISRPYHLLGVTISLRFLYGSLLLAVLVSLVNHLPFAVQAQLNTLMQLDLSLEEAAYVCRASFRQALVRIYLPLLRHGVVTTWLLLFIFVFKEIDTLAFVYAPLAFSTTGLGFQHLTRASPIMYHVFGLINSAEQPELYAQGTGLLLLTCLILLGTTLLVARTGWQSFEEQLRR